MSTEQLTNRYHFCRQAPIVDDVMGTIVEHATDLVRKYDGTYFYIAWLSANEEVKFHATVNCGLLLDVSRHVIRTFTAKANSLLQRNVFCVRAKPQSVVTGYGSSTPRANAQGWWNKKRAISSKLAKLFNEGFELPAVIVLGGKKSDVQYTYPPNDADMDALARVIVSHFGKGCEHTGRGIPPNYPALAPSSPKRMSTTNLCRNSAKRTKVDPQQADERSNMQYSAVDHVHQAGTVAWYSNLLKSLTSVPVQALIKSETSYHWVCLDARKHGSKMAVHHGIFVEVELQVDTHEYSCSCEVFRQSGCMSTCIHIEYIKVNIERLRQMDFGPPGGIYRISKNDGQTAGYYVDGCFVRPQGRKGLRCDSDLSYHCRHVHQICAEYRISPPEDSDSGDEDSSDEGEEKEHLPTNKWLQEHASRHPIPFPYEADIKKGVVMMATHGFGPNPVEDPELWFGRELKPDIPTKKCLCGLRYREEDMVYDKDCIVYLRDPHCARRMRCKQLHCPNQRAACSVHYLGIRHGLLRISATQAVQLDLLVDCAMDMNEFSGAALSAQCDKLRKKYEFFQSAGLNEERFVEVNTFRSAVYTVASSLKINFDSIFDRCKAVENRQGQPMNMMLCPICKDCPRVIIMDGTSMTIKSDLCRSNAFTDSTGWDDAIKKRPHLAVQRSFIDVGVGQRKRRPRSKLMSLLQEFEAWIQKDDGKRCAFRKMSYLLPLARIWRVDGFLDWVHTACKGRDVPRGHRAAMKAMIREIASPSPVTSYLSHSDAHILRQCLQKLGNRVPERTRRALSPIVKHLLGVITPDGQDGVAIPALWLPFLEELVERALKIHGTYLTSNEVCKAHLPF